MEQKSRNKQGILISNLGTPNTPTPRDVGQYLREFLNDPHVIDIPAVLRWLLVNVLIVPKRSVASAEAYAKVWTERGSPLLFHSLDFITKLKTLIVTDKSGLEVALGMRYGSPSIESAVRELVEKGVREILFFPLYPQYSYAATRSSIVHFNRVMDAKFAGIKKNVITDFYAHPKFIEAYVEQIRKELANTPVDHILFSYHGVPVRQIRRVAECSGSVCEQLTRTPCPKISPANRLCYRAQAYATTQAIALQMGLDKNYSVSFQSRLGRTKWIEPYTDEVLTELPKAGVKSLAVVCPSFVTDCLETVEEIELRGRALFLENGGESFKLIACLNSEENWVNAAHDIVQEYLSL